MLESGSDLSSRAVSSQVLSARRGLTSVFGMGTGGSPLPLPPENCRFRSRSSLRFHALASHFCSCFRFCFASLLCFRPLLSLRLSRRSSAPLAASAFRFRQVTVSASRVLASLRSRVSPLARFHFSSARLPLPRFASPDNCTAQVDLGTFQLYLRFP